MSIKILNAFCGIGGNRKLWSNCIVTAIDNNQSVIDGYSYNFPQDNVICCDAYDYILKHYLEYDFIWCSPSCLTHSRMNYYIVRKKPQLPDMRLYSLILFLKQFCSTPWVVENVKSYYDPLIKPTALVGRHFIWSNYSLLNKVFPPVSKMFALHGSSGVESLSNFFGLQLNKNIYINGSHSQLQVFRNCVPPDVGLYIYSSIINQLLF